MREIYSEKCSSDKRACKRSGKQQEDAIEDAENYYSCAMKQLSQCLSNKSRTNKHWHIANDITRRKQSSGNFRYNEKVFHSSISHSVCVCRLLAWRQVFAHYQWTSKEKSLPETKKKTVLRWGTWQCWRFQFFFLVGCYFVRFTLISICVVSFWCRICTIFVWTLDENVFEVYALARA